MSRYVPLGIGIALVLAATIVHGAMTLRWTGGSSEAVAAISERYKEIPKELGGGTWISEDTEINPRELVAAGATASISRRYRNIHTNKVVQVFMVCGLARNTAVHTPDICYCAQGYKMERPPHVTDLVTGNTKSRAYVDTFSKQTPQGPVFQRILWTWNDGTGWKAPDSPRVTYRGWTALNKLYLIAVGRTSEEVTAAENAELAEFANLFLPLVSQTLYPPAESEASQ